MKKIEEIPWSEQKRIVGDIGDAYCHCRKDIPGTIVSEVSNHIEVLNAMIKKVNDMVKVYDIEMSKPCKECNEE